MREELRYSDLAAMLRDQPQLVIDRYCSTDGAYLDHMGRHFCLNPMRADKSVGSFFINTRGPSQGRWHDYANGQGGDVLDLVKEVDNLDVRGAALAAKQLLGIVEMDARTRSELEANRRQREERTMFQRKTAEAKRQRARNHAHKLYLEAHPAIELTPVVHYLAARCIHLDAFPRLPNAIRYLPDCYYRRDDPETGEIFEHRWPTMVAPIIARDGSVMGLHRTYLGQDATGVWRKADVPDPKKILGGFKEGAIRLWSGIGPRGGKGSPLALAPHGTRVYVTEGIEDGLSAVRLKPDARVLVAISLDNMARIALPDNVTEVVLVADNDPGEQAKALFDRAVAAHQEAGRTVRVWRATHGKDLNDELRHAMEAGHAA